MFVWLVVYETNWSPRLLEIFQKFFRVLSRNLPRTFIQGVFDWTLRSWDTKSSSNHQPRVQSWVSKKWSWIDLKDGWRYEKNSFRILFRNIFLRFTHGGFCKKCLQNFFEKIALNFFFKSYITETIMSEARGFPGL